MIPYSWVVAETKNSIPEAPISMYRPISGFIVGLLQEAGDF